MTRILAPSLAAMSTLLGLAAHGSAQEPARVRVSGYVRSAASAEVIRHALVTADGERVRRESNEDGFYFLSLSPARISFACERSGMSRLTRPSR